MKLDIAFDLEANNLLPMVDTIHVLVVKLIGKPEGEEASYRVVHTAEELLKILPHVNRVVSHNGLCYDLWTILRLWGIPFEVSICGKKDTWGGYPVQFVDTFHLSMYLNPDRIGGHSLEAWSQRLSDTDETRKIANEDWSVYTPRMLERCKMDCNDTEKTYKYLLSEMNDRSEQE